MAVRKYLIDENKSFTGVENTQGRQKPKEKRPLVEQKLLLKTLVNTTKPLHTKLKVI